MKKLSILLVLVMMVSLLAACGAGTTDPAGGETPGETTYVIANTPKCVGIAWWDRMEVGNDRFVKATGHEVYQVGPAGQADTAVQVSTIEDVISTGVNAITVIPSDPDAVETTLAKAREQGIVVISHEAEGMKNVDYDIEAFVNAEYGAHMMDVLAEEMGEEGGYCIMLGALTMASHQQWTEGAIKRQEEAYPNMFQVCDPVESQAGGGSQEGSYKVAKEVIATYPDIKGFIGCDMVNPPGIAMAVEEAGKAGEISVTGTCLVSVANEYLNSGTIKTICFWDPADAGQAMCSLAVMLLNGEEVKDGMNLNVPGYEKCTVKGNIVFGSAWVDVTKANMADYNF